jgi:hypothetical protein
VLLNPYNGCVKKSCCCSHGTAQSARFSEQLTLKVPACTCMAALTQPPSHASSHSLPAGSWVTDDDEDFIQVCWGNCNMHTMCWQPRSQRLSSIVNIICSVYRRTTQCQQLLSTLKQTVMMCWRHSYSQSLHSSICNRRNDMQSWHQKAIHTYPWHHQPLSSNSCEHSSDNRRP